MQFTVCEPARAVRAAAATHIKSHLESGWGEHVATFVDDLAQMGDLGTGQVEYGWYWLVNPRTGKRTSLNFESLRAGVPENFVGYVKTAPWELGIELACSILARLPVRTDAETARGLVEVSRIGSAEKDAERAVDFVRHSPGGLMWNGGPRDATPDEVLSAEMSCRGGAFDLLGWRAESLGHGNYLVSLTYRPRDDSSKTTTWQGTPSELVRTVNGIEERGWFWDVSPEAGISRFLGIEDFASPRELHGLSPAPK